MPKDEIHGEIHNDTLDKLFAMLVEASPGESENARERMRSALGTLGVHVSHVKLIYGGDLLNRLYDRNVELERRAETAEKENYFLRQQASKQSMRKLKVMRSAAGDRWEELFLIVKSKISPKRGWEKRAAEALGLTGSVWRSYKEGLTAVPEMVLERARQLERIPDPPLARRMRQQEQMPIPLSTLVLKQGPMTADELRLIGAFFNGTDWLEGVARIAMAKKKTIAEWPKRGVPAAQAALLRKRHHEHNHSAVPEEALLI